LEPLRLALAEGVMVVAAGKAAGGYDKPPFQSVVPPRGAGDGVTLTFAGGTGSG